MQTTLGPSLGRSLACSNAPVARQALSQHASLNLTAGLAPAPLGDDAASTTLRSIPLFSPSLTPLSGLELLTAVAEGAKDPPAGIVATTSASRQPLLPKGMYNPAASLPPRLVKRILDLEFVEMAEISIDEV